MCARERILPIPNMCEMLLHMHINCMGEQRQAFIAQMHYCCSTKLFETGKFTQSKVVGKSLNLLCFAVAVCYDPFENGRNRDRKGRERRTWKRVLYIEIYLRVKNWHEC